VTVNELRAELDKHEGELEVFFRCIAPVEMIEPSLSAVMDIGEWKRRAKTILMGADSAFDAPMWSEVLDALLKASENEGLEQLDDRIEKLS